MKSILIFCLLLLITAIHAQKHDQNFVLGRGNFGSKFPNDRLFFMKFDDTGGYEFEAADSDSNGVNTFGRGTTSYSDINGNLRFISNCFHIFDASYNIMENGDTINPGWAWNYYYSKYTVLYYPHGVVGLPVPGNEDKLAYLFHLGLDTCFSCKPLPFLFGSPMYYSKIDLEGNGGLGSVVEKNVVIAKGRFMPWSFTKHANGRDWWIMAPEEGKNIYWRFLVTPNGVEGPWNQVVGPEPIYNQSTMCSSFSPNGDKFAHGWQKQAVVVFDFDRCTGILSKPNSLVLSDTVNTFWTQYPAGLSFSASGRFCYLVSALRVFQLDTEEFPMQLDTIGYCQECNKCLGNIGQQDGQSYEFISQLAPDGNIYSAGFGINKCIFMIQNSDKKFPEHDVKIVQVPTPYLQSSGMPYFPNYRLGPLVGSPCDTLTTSTSVLEQTKYRMKIFPNPAKGNINVEISLPSYGVEGSTELKVYDIMGRAVYEHVFPSYSYIHNIPAGSLPTGYYTALLVYKGSVVSNEKFGVVE